MTHLSLTTSLAVAISVLATFPAASQENIRGDTTGPTTAPGYSHPDQFWPRLRHYRRFLRTLPAPPLSPET